MKIQAFFLKYRTKIIVCVVLLLLSVFFVPSQEAHYLRDTVKHFQHSILKPILIGLCIVSFLIVAVLRIINIKSLKDALTGAFSFLILLVCMSIIFERLVLSGVLFVNRLITTERKIEKQYVVKFHDASPDAEKQMLVFDAVSNEQLGDEILIENIRQQGIPLKEPVTVWFNKGILGIEYPHMIDVKRDK